MLKTYVMIKNRYHIISELEMLIESFDHEYQAIGNEIKVVPTQLFNGYQDYVEHLYTKDQKYYF